MQEEHREVIKKDMEMLILKVKVLEKEHGKSRHTSLTVTKLEEAEMWFKKDD